MNKEILDAFLAIINQGGAYALWGVGIWLLVSLIKALAGLLTVYLVCRLLVVGIMQYRAVKLERISIISQEASAKLEQCLRDISQKSRDMEKAYASQSPSSDTSSAKK